MVIPVMAIIVVMELHFDISRNKTRTISSSQVRKRWHLLHILLADNLWHYVFAGPISRAATVTAVN